MSTTLLTKFNDAFKTAMKAKDKATVACIRQVKSKMQEIENSGSFTGEINDELFLTATAAYVKSLKKGIVELGGAEGQGGDLVAGYQKEIDYLSEYLPTMMSKEEIKPIVKGLIEKANITDPKQSGRIIGMFMKDYKGKAEASDVKACIDEAFA